jgi:uncharacterized protein with NRDE domain
MCIILTALDVHPRYPLILLSNRDEFYSRETLPLHRWEGDVPMYAGRDLKEGGAWLGMTARGRIATVTNYREPPKEGSWLSRGLIVSRFLAGEDGPSDFLHDLQEEGDRYRPLNVLCGYPDSLYYYSNRGEGVHRVEPGILGLSNGLLDEPWPKVERGKRLFSELVQQEDEFPVEKAFSIMKDTRRPPDESLPDTGFGLEGERFLSTIFIQGEKYGTRCTTLVLVDRDGNAYMEERIHVPDKQRNVFRFRLE